MSILIIGYYDRNNLGDDMYKNAFTKMLPSYKLEFLCADDIGSKNNEYYNSFNAIVFGGGDLVNEYFNKHVKYIRSVYNKCIYALSIGIPYKNLIEHNYLNYYDHVFTRNKSYLLEIQHAIGSQYIHYLPDFVMKSFKINDNDINLEERLTIGVFLTCSLYNLEPLFVDLFIKILENTNCKLHLLCFDTGNDVNNNDKKINKKLYNSLDKYKDRIINDVNRYSEDDMYKLICSFRMCVCSRFHSHILSTLAGIPFIGIHYELKAVLFLQENKYPYHTKFNFDKNYIPISFNVEDVYKNFIDVNNNLNKTRELLLNIAKKQQFLLDTNIVENIIKKNERRIIQPNYLYINRVNVIYEKYKHLLEYSYKCKLEEVKNYITPEFCDGIARRMAYDITKEIHSDYIFGMKRDFQEKPEQLKGMIDWVWKDKREKVMKIPKLNMEVTSLNNFNGLHRAGWQFALESIKSLHSNYGPILDVYCDATFGWARLDPCSTSGLIPYLQPWCGFFHHTPDAKYSTNNIENSTNTKEFIQSLETCIGLFTLSEYLAIWLRDRLSSHGYPNIPVNVLYHPTLLNVKQFDINILNKDKINIVNVGAWLRNSYSIYRLEVPEKFNKLRLKGKLMDAYFPSNDISFSKIDISLDNSNPFLFCLYSYIIDKEFLWYELGYKSKDEVPENFISTDEYSIQLKTYIKEQIKSVTTLEYLSNQEYDDLLTNSICMIDFLDASAANTLIECIARCNPIIVNNIPPIVEYIGKDYPLLYDDLKDVPKLLTIENINKAYKYLKESDIKNKISSETFLTDIYNSEILKSII